MAAKKSAAKKTSARKTSKTSSAATNTATNSKVEAPEAAEQTEGRRVPRVPAGGIDPRLVEQRDRQREAEKGVTFARASEPARLDPKLAEIRDRTKKREAELANRSLTKPPARG